MTDNECTKKKRRTTTINYNYYYYYYQTNELKKQKNLLEYKNMKQFIHLYIHARINIYTSILYSWIIKDCDRMSANCIRMAFWFMIFFPFVCRCDSIKNLLYNFIYIYTYLFLWMDCSGFDSLSIYIWFEQKKTHPAAEHPFVLILSDWLIDWLIDLLIAI